MKFFTICCAVLVAFVSAQGTSPNASISIYQALAGYPALSTLYSLLTGPLANTSLVTTLNSTSNAHPLTFFAPTNAAIAPFSANSASGLLDGTIDNTTFLEIFAANHILPESLNSTLLSQKLANANSSRHLLLDVYYGKKLFTTLAQLNVTIDGLVQNSTTLPVPPLIFVNNALVVQFNAIVAENGVVHLVSNVIDPFIAATGGFYGPSPLVVAGLVKEFGPYVELALNALDIKIST